MGSGDVNIGTKLNCAKYRNNSLGRGDLVPDRFRPGGGRKFGILIDGTGRADVQCERVPVCSSEAPKIGKTDARALPTASTTIVVGKINICCDDISTIPEKRVL